MIEIIPNWHPIWVHFAVALLLTSTVLAILGLFQRPKSSGPTQAVIVSRWLLFLGALVSIVALGTGLMAASTVAHDEAAHANMIVHRNWALAAATLYVVAALVEFTARSKARIHKLTLLVSFVGAIALSITAFEGGQNVYEHGLGVMRLPDVSSHDHDSHDHSSSPAIASNERNVQAASDEMSSTEDHSSHEHKALDPAYPSDNAGPREQSEGTDETSIEIGGVGTVSDLLFDALSAADVASVERLLHADVMIYESGNVESSYGEYAGHHMPADMAFLASIERTVLSRHVHEMGENDAVVSTHAKLYGERGGKSIEVVSTETLVVQRTAGRWQIVHIHWSSGS